MCVCVCVCTSFWIVICTIFSITKSLDVYSFIGNNVNKREKEISKSGKKCLKMDIVVKKRVGMRERERGGGMK